MSNGVNGRKLDGIITEKGYNYVTLAKEAGTTRETISSVVNGKNRPSHRVMNALYYALDLTRDEGIEIFFAENLRDTKD